MDGGSGFGTPLMVLLALFLNKVLDHDDPDPECECPIPVRACVGGRVGPVGKDEAGEKIWIPQRAHGRFSLLVVRPEIPTLDK